MRQSFSLDSLIFKMIKKQSQETYRLLNCMQAWRMLKGSADVDDARTPVENQAAARPRLICATLYHEILEPRM